MNNVIELRDITVEFDGERVLDRLNLSIGDGEFVTLLGSSGCGKTTTLRVIAGFIQPQSGEVFFDGKSVAGLPPYKRPVNTIFQRYALFPNYNVYENIAFGLKLKKVPKDEIKERVTEMLRLVNLSGFENRSVTRLSGGQQQRAAIARALINQPKVLLLDEPLAALDLKLRQHMLLELDTIHDQVGITFLYVTHDQGEAMSLSDRIAVINKGKIEQLAGPAQIYEAPASRFVASFIGDTNFFHGEIVSVDGDYCFIQVEGFPQIKAYNDRRLSVGQEIDLSVRPEKIRVTLTPPPPEKGASINVFPSKVKDIVYQGVYTKFWVTSSGLQIQSLKPHSRFLLDQEPITWNDEVFVWWHPDDGYMVAAEN